MTHKASILLLLALSLAIYVGNAAWPALLDDADASHAIAAREMLETRNLAVLHINGIRWLEKAPLHYWLVASSYALLGENTFATRLPLALAVVGLVLMVYAFGRRFFGERVGFYSGLVMCTSIGAFIFTRIVIPEAIYALEFTAAFYLFFRAWTGTLGPRAGYWGCAALLALVVLTRGLIGLIFPLAIISLFVLLSGGWRGWRDPESPLRKIPLISSALIFLFLAVPWHLIVGLRTPRFFWFYFVNEHFLRALGQRYPPDYAAVPLGLWLAAHLAWFFPWSFFLPYALREFPRLRAVREGLDAAGQARLFLFLWAGFILFFFSVTTGSRMEYYSFGGWPAIALLLGLGLERAEAGSHRWLPRLQTALALAGLLAAANLGVLVWLSRNVRTSGDISSLLKLHDTDFYRVSMASFFDLTPQAFAALRLPAMGAALSFLIGLAAAWLLRRRGRSAAANLAMGLMMVGFFFSANLAYQAFEPRMSSRPLARAVLKQLQPDDQIVIYGEFDPGSSLSFYTRRKVWIYNGRYNGLEFGSYYPDAPRIFLTDNDFPAMWRGPHRVFLFVPPEQHEAALVRLPLDSTYLLAESGGKTIYLNRPLTPDQPTLAQLRPRASGQNP